MTIDESSLPLTFLAHAADILGDTSSGLSGNAIVQATRQYAAEYAVELTYPIYPNDAPNKRSALLENLKCFNGPQQHRILRELCSHRWFGPRDSSERRQIKLQLASTYAQYNKDTEANALNEPVAEDARRWLMNYPTVLKIYNEAIEKYRGGLFQRNVLDDLRLGLETLLKIVFQNEKSLENQVSMLGSFLKQNGGSTELSNMFVKLVDYYSKYQNSYVKHNNAVIEQEIEFMIEITASFMKHIVRLSEAR